MNIEAPPRWKSRLPMSPLSMLPSGKMKSLAQQQKERVKKGAKRGATQHARDVCAQFHLQDTCLSQGSGADGEVVDPPEHTCLCKGSSAQFHLQDT